MFECRTCLDIGCKYCNNQKGFTSVGLMVAVVIIGILAAVAIPSSNKTQMLKNNNLQELIEMIKHLLK